MWVYHPFVVLITAIKRGTIRRTIGLDNRSFHYSRGRRRKPRQIELVGETPETKRRRSVRSKTRHLVKMRLGRENCEKSRRRSVRSSLRTRKNMTFVTYSYAPCTLPFKVTEYGISTLKRCGKWQSVSLLLPYAP